EHTSDQIESIGIARSKQNAEKAHIILHVVDATTPEQAEMDWLAPFATKTIEVWNKIDRVPHLRLPEGAMGIAAKQNLGIDALKERMYTQAVDTAIDTEDTIVTNARHFDALNKMM